MFAIIQTGGKQYLVKPGETLQIEKLEKNAGDALSFEAMLVAQDDDSGVKVGTPFIKGAAVSATVVKQVVGEKVSIVKYKPKSRYRRHTGHRQLYTEIKIEKITA